jgi:hypothetical protein
VCGEVRVLDAVGRQVGVELGGGEVGVAQHLLQRAQVAAPAEQVGGERVAQRVGLICASSPAAGGVTLDDLVEALAGQWAAAAIQKQPRLGLVFEQHGAPAAAVGAECGQRLAPDRHDPLLRALAAGAQQPLVEVDVGELEADRLGGAQAARVHQLEQGAVAQSERR